MGGAEKLRDKARVMLREPLLHFLIAGLAVFALSIWRGDAVDPDSRTITIGEDKVVQLSASWEQTWRRPPSQREMDAMIRDYIKEEIYYREARRLGLDEDDAVIRRRLRSKMEFLAGAEAESARPDDNVLRAWLQKYPSRFAPDAEYYLDQIYLGSENAGNAAATLKALAQGADWTKQGVAISLPKSLERAGRAEVEKRFGEDFAKSVAALSSGAWSGPVASGFGLHLVRVRDVRAPSIPKLADVRQIVENDWRAATYKDREAKAYQALLDGYKIRIAKP